MNYKIITDLQLLKEFVEWLPELEANEKYYLSLFARKKYCKGITSNAKTQLKRFTSNKERLIDKISQLEIPTGRYFLKNEPAPQMSLALYISVNPRDMKKATQMLGKRCWDLLNGENYNIHAEALSCIQKSKSQTRYVDFDIDDKSVDLDKEWLTNRIGDSYKILETRGGYHVLVDPQKANSHSTNVNWFNDIRKKYPIDQAGDNLIPVPGCVQGGFTPMFV